MNKILIITILFVVSCVPYSAKELRKDPQTHKLSFTSNYDYKITYNKILKKLRECESNSIVQGDIDTEEEKGIITVITSGIDGIHYTMAIDISSIDESQSKVKEFYWSNWSKPEALAVEGWINYDETSCTKGY
jgi:hypothetical protein